MYCVMRVGCSFAVGGLLAAFATACGGEESDPTATAPSNPHPPRVSALRYSPKPFSDDMTEMTVRFTTTAHPDVVDGYSVHLVTGIDHHGSGCYPEWEAIGPPRHEGTGGTYTMTLDSNSVFVEDTFFCPGRAVLTVRTPGDTVARKLSFRILSARD